MHLLLEDSPQETIVQAGGCEHSHIFGSWVVICMWQPSGIDESGVE
jgi:hypothetical protein